MIPDTKSGIIFLFLVCYYCVTNRQDFTEMDKKKRPKEWDFLGSFVSSKLSFR